MPFDAFLKIGDIKGESRDIDHKDWIDVLSYSFAVDSEPPDRSGGGGRASGKPRFSDVQVEMQQSTASVPLLAAVTTGRVLPTATLALRRATGETKGGGDHFYEVELFDVVVTSFAESAADGDDAVPNSVALNFSKVTWAYAPQDPKSGTTGPAIEAGWDLTRNQKV